MPMVSGHAIGIFDSGIGGLSVLRHIQSLLPHEHVLYFADSGNAPYGNKPESEVVARSLAIADFLVGRGAKALVVACNTATAAAISALRQRYPTLPVVGVEPGLKPGSVATRNGKVGVLATEGTLSSAKFLQLRDQVTETTGTRFLLQACTGLATQIEKGELHSPATSILLQRFLLPLVQEGADTLVLGCTHYPFVRPLIDRLVANCRSDHILIIDTGEAVARQLERILSSHRLQIDASTDGTLEAFTTGSMASLSSAFAKLLNVFPTISTLSAKTHQ